MSRRKSTASQPAKKPKGGPRTYGRLNAAIEAAVRREITSAMEENGGNVTHAAKALGISLRGLWKRIEALGIKPKDFRE
jgi:DNA-binding NtrC family response regulator